MFVEIKQEINIKNSLKVKYIKINKKNNIRYKIFDKIEINDIM